MLVVDDERDTREMLKVMIGQLGAEVKACASSEDAMNLLGEWRPDVIVSTIEMPDEDGFERNEGGHRKNSPSKPHFIGPTSAQLND